MLFTGVVTAAEDRYAIVQEKQDDDKNESHPHRRPTNPVDGIGLAGRENARDEGAALGGEELDGEEEEDGEEQKSNRAQQLGNGLGDGLALVANKGRHHKH
ncbi:hypothetical protein F2P56_027343 [Juglans regia]|uniref:Uncharacterized protein n=1 Tax=Juglans regia TaxID=51240 RepID=A0A833X8X2_JUGRE|nr:hypothetical protein F2P56_027343 [Juglans regia]